MKKCEAAGSTNDSAVNEYRKHLWDALRAGQEQYDKYLLTLSGGGLAISLTLVKDIFGKSNLACPAVLIVSWAFFCISIVSTIASFITSQKSLRRQLSNYEVYVSTGDDAQLNISDPTEKLTNFLNYLSGSCFLIAVAATISFASINLERGGLMAHDKTVEDLQKTIENLRKDFNAPPVPQHRHINEGYVAPPPPRQQKPKPDTTPKTK